MARIAGSAIRSKPFTAPVAGAAMLLRTFLSWLRHGRTGAPAGRGQHGFVRQPRPARARLAQDLDEHLLDDVGAPCWLREQARLRREALLRSMSDLPRL
jgi:hypothetical protein